MNLKVPKKTNSFLVWSFNDILTVLLPLWLLCLISEFRYAPIDSFFAAPFYLSGNNWLGTGSFFFSAVLHKGGKYVAVAVAVSSLILFLLSYLKKFARLKPYRKSACTSRFLFRPVRSSSAAWSPYPPLLVLGRFLSTAEAGAPESVSLQDTPLPVFVCFPFTLPSASSAWRDLGFSLSSL